MVRAAGGLAPLDIERFWADDARAHAAPFAADCPQMPLGIRMAPECIFVELGVEPDWRRLWHDDAFWQPLARRYNDQAERIVGRRLLDEKTNRFQMHRWPEIRQLHDIFEGRNTWHEESFSYWLHPAAETEDELKALLDRVEQRLENLRASLLPPDWDEQKARLIAERGPIPPYRGQRGPVTFAMSLYGAEKLIFLIMDNPGLAARYRDVIIRAMLERARILDEEAGFTPANAPHGWGWWDDNCALLNAEMYEFFGWPILQAMFDRYSPNPGDRRYQHSDSEMAHLLPLLGKLNMTRVNLGPTISIDEIRAHLPRAIIDGQLAPFTFSRNEEVNLVAELLRDFEMSRAHRGVVFTTAGSINDGSRLSGMRLLMAAIQEYGQY